MAEANGRKTPALQPKSGWNVLSIITHGFRERWHAVTPAGIRGPLRKSYNSAVADTWAGS